MDQVHHISIYAETLNNWQSVQLGLGKFLREDEVAES